MLPIDPTPVINGASKFGAITYISVLILIILAAVVFFLLKSMVRQNRDAVTDRVRTVDGYVAYVEKKSREGSEIQEKLMELHANTVKAVDRVSEALGKLCGDSDANQRANSSAMAAITASNESNQKSVISAIDIMQREHRACLESTSLVCSNFGLVKAVSGGKSGRGKNIRRTRVAKSASG